MPEPTKRRLRLASARTVGAVLSACLAAASSSSGAAERPIVGVAFSGGGAKGCAHVGVLRVLDELRVPVGRAAGTSMGAIVGGLYASGMDPDELETELLSVDWDDALRDRPPREQLVFRRKNDDLRYFADLELGLGRGGLLFPTGLRSGQKLGHLLRELTVGVRDVEDFDRFPVPFRAVATDIGTGEPVVLGRGDLARALRASMAIPGVFSAVELNGRLLVDGGVTDNVPVDVVRAMGADEVIAIDIGEPLASAEEAGRSFLGIVGQTLGLITRNNMKPQLAAADLVIAPEVGEFGTLEFARCREIVELGELEARRHAEELRRFAVPEPEYLRWRQRFDRPRAEPPKIAGYRIEGLSRVDRRVVEALIEAGAGSTYEPEAIRRDLERIYGLGDFESVDAELESESGEQILVYRAKEKPWGPTYLRAGVTFESDLDGASELALLAGVDRSRINALGGEWRTDLELGSDREVQTELYQPLSFRSDWFLAPRAAYRRRLRGLWEDGREVAELDLRIATVGIDVGREFGRLGEARLGIERGYLRAERSTGIVPEAARPFVGRRLQRGGLRLELTLDRLDSVKVPSRGSLLRLGGYRSIESLGAADEFNRVTVRALGFHTRGRWTMFADLDAGLSPGGELPLPEEFVLGGFLSLSGYARGELRAQEFAILRAGGYLRLSRWFRIGGFAELAGLADSASELTSDPILAVTGLVVSDTPLGPLYLGYGRAEGGGGKVYVLFGRGL